MSGAFSFLFKRKREFDSVEWKEDQLDPLLKRHRLSQYLPYMVYDPDRKLYYNKDDTYGLIFWGVPQWNENQKARNYLKTLIDELPDRGVLSVHLMALPLVDQILEGYLAARIRKDPLVERNERYYIEFLKKSVQRGMPQLLGIKLRRFIGIISIKFPAGSIHESTLPEYVSSVETTMKNILLGAVHMKPDFLIYLLSLLFNGPEETLNSYNPKRDISSQIIMADNRIEVFWEYIKMNSGYWGAVTPKDFPPEIGTEQIGYLTGSTLGSQYDSKQLTDWFIHSVVVCRFPEVEAEISRKAGLYMQQIKGDAQKSLLGRLTGEYFEEYSRATLEMEKGKGFFVWIPSLVVRGETREALRSNLQRVKDVWSEHGLKVQEEKGGLQTLMFLLNLPLGCSLTYKNLSMLDRHFIDNSETVAGMCPVVGEIAGLGTDKPATLFVGRKGQLVPFDLFTKIAPSKNFVVIGTTGGGKSVNMNLLMKAMYSSGAKIFILDLGYSYQRLCSMVKGVYIDFSYDSPLCMNPFTFINSSDKEDVEGSIAAIKDILLSILFFSGDKGGNLQKKKEHEDLIEYAIRFAWNEFGNDAGIDQIFEYLSKFPALCGDEREAFCTTENGEEVCLASFKKEAQMLAFALHNWTSRGPYGKWFNGRAEIDFSSDFIVLEMERLKRNRLFMSIITMSCLHAITANLYLTDRAIRKVVLIEECGILFEEAPYLTAVVKEAYRRVRKYNGAIGTVFQSPYDLHNIGPAAKTITANTPYWFMLPCDQYPALTSDPELKYFGFDEWEVNLLRSLQLVRPRYGEVYLRTPLGRGVVRTVLDGFSYYLITTDPDDYKEIKNAFKTKKSQLEVSGKKLTSEEERKLLADVLEELGRKRDENMEKKFLMS